MPGKSSWRCPRGSRLLPGARLPAETQDQAERQRILDRVRRDGFMSGYRGVRIAKSGRRFIIADGVVWEMIDKQGTRHGQAATFSSWRDI